MLRDKKKENTENKPISVLEHISYDIIYLPQKLILEILFQKNFHVFWISCFKNLISEISFPGFYSENLVSENFFSNFFSRNMSSRSPFLFSKNKIIILKILVSVGGNSGRGGSKVDGIFINGPVVSLVKWRAVYITLLKNLVLSKYVKYLLN